MPLDSLPPPPGPPPWGPEFDSKAREASARSNRDASAALVEDLKHLVGAVVHTVLWPVRTLIQRP